MNDNSEFSSQGHGDAEGRAELARHHAARFPAMLALARWRSGALPVSFAYNDGLFGRHCWYARQQRAFQTWLELGGFPQHDAAAAAEPAPVPAAPDGTAQPRFANATPMDPA